MTCTYLPDLEPGLEEPGVDKTMLEVDKGLVGGSTGNVFISDRSASNLDCNQKSHNQMLVIQRQYDKVLYILDIRVLRSLIFVQF